MRRTPKSNSHTARGAVSPLPVEVRADDGDPLTAALTAAARSHPDRKFREWCRRLLRGDAAGADQAAAGERGQMSGGQAPPGAGQHPGGDEDGKG
jgi:hypothetical protein